MRHHPMRGRGSATATVVLLLVGLPLAALAGVATGHAALILRTGLVGVGVAGVAVGVLWHRPKRVRPWLLLLTGLVSSLVGDVTVLAASRDGLVASNVPLDAWLTATASVLILAGMLDATRAVRGVDLGGSLDALVFAIAGGTAVWQALVVPAAARGWIDSRMEATGAVQILLLIGVFALMVRTATLVAPGRRLATVLLSVALVLAIGAFLLGAAYDAGVGSVYLGPRAALGAAANLLAGAAALHPSMRALTDRVRVPSDELSVRRILALGAAALVPPAIVAESAVRESPVGLLGIAIAWMVLTGVGLARVHLLGRGRDLARRETAEVERRLMSMVAHTGDTLLLVRRRRGQGPTIEFASPAAQDLLGCPPAALIGREIATIPVAEDAPVLVACVLDPVSTPRATDVRVPGADGQLRWVEVVVDGYPSPDAAPAHVVTLRDVTARKHAELTWQEESRRDPLTGLLNRRGIEERLEQLLANVTSRTGEVAVVLCDLDDFKSVNDGLGHAAGDGVLQQVANRMRSCVRDGDLVGRIGGDEFVLVLDAVEDRSAVVVIADRLVEAMRTPLLAEDEPVVVGVSAGVVTCARRETSVNRMLRAADVALYEAKRAGKAQVIWAATRAGSLSPASPRTRAIVSRT